jgi:hypothetical protein
MDAQCTHIAAGTLNAQQKAARDIYVWYAVSRFKLILDGIRGLSKKFVQ